MNFIITISTFVLAGLCEIEGYLIWLCLKEEKPVLYGILSGFLLTIYGIVAPFQPNNFARTYTAYGEIFIIMSLIWAHKFDDFKPDKFDIIGASVVFMGISIIFFAKK